MNTYNARDQVTLVQQYQGTETSVVHLDTTTTYDGYGRVKSQHAPEQQADPNIFASTDHTTADYYADDTIYSVADARGASQTFTYNNRRLITGISYGGPAAITASANVSYDYDSTGKRISMTDGLGSQTYSYDQLSRMTSETRTFSGFGTYSINYAYNLSNELTSITDPFGAQVGYNYDVVGRVNSVTGSGFSNVSTYASAFQYRAGGQLSHMTLGNYNQPLSATYNARLQPLSFTTLGISMSYQYYDDGRVKFSQDMFDHRFDRSYSYDSAGRLSSAYSGAEARGEPATNNRPYKQDYTFDVWDNLTSRTGKHWSHYNTFFGTYVNNRMDGWQYDADGRNTVSNSVTSTFDAAGSLIQTSGPQRRNNPPLVLTQGFDGDGQRLKKVEYGETYYFLRSTVLGGAVITEIYGTANQFFGQKQRGRVYVNGSEIAQQIPGLGEAVFTAGDPSGVETGSQLDPLGNDVGDEDPYLPDPGDPGFSYPHMGDMSDPSGGCQRDGIPMNCSSAFGKSRLRRVFDLFLPKLNRFRPRNGFPNTPPIRSNSDITLGSIFQGATQGTILGDVLNPKLDWRFIVPFIPWGSLYANPQQRSDSPAKTDPEAFNKRPQPLPGLPPCVKDYLSKFFDRSMLDAITWDHGIPWFVPMRDASAFTLDDVIYFGDGQYDPLNGISIDEMVLIGHEVTHSRQYRENGSLRQKRNYLVQSAVKGIAGAIVGTAAHVDGLAWNMAYYGNKYEKEAFEMGKKIRADLVKNGNPCP